MIAPKTPGKHHWKTETGGGGGPIPKQLMSSLSLTTWSYHLPRSRQDCGAIAECARSSSLREQGCAIKPKLSFKEYVGINRLQPPGLEPGSPAWKDREKKRKELHAVISLSAGFCI
ncbi:uncharacterized protein LOC143661361 isoform X2 [Tamandua tetradactyla]|uniref:uncharacterized protein LOC143661361 isoform X2 n=1 Tax=Tamandua tetradactyla TaxID=48850 RepID=UPI004053A95F